MKRNWVRFCEHAIQSDWKPDAVGEKTNPDAGHARFGSVPVVRCKATNQGWAYSRLNKGGKWVEFKKRARSLSPVKPSATGQFYGRGDIRRMVPPAQDCPLASVPVRNSCDAHILEHMRCTCAACQDFACQWRRALKHKMRAAVGDMASLADTKPKPRRWTYKIGGHSKPVPKMHKPTPCPVKKPETPKRWPYVGSPRVNWWFGNYVPCDSSSDDNAGYDSMSDVCKNCNDEDDYHDEDFKGDRSNAIKSTVTPSDRPQNEDSHEENGEVTPPSSAASEEEEEKDEKGEGPLSVADLTTDEERNSPCPQKQSDPSTQKENLKETRVAEKRRTTRAKLWSNNATVSSGSRSKFSGETVRTSQWKTGQAVQRLQPPRRRYRAKSAGPTSSGRDAFEKVVMDGFMSNIAMADHFRSVTCTDPASKALSTRGYRHYNRGGGMEPWRGRGRCRSNKERVDPAPSFVTCVQEQQLSGSKQSSGRTVERDSYPSECDGFDRSANNRDKETSGSGRRPSREKSRKPRRTKRKKSEDRTFIPEDLRRNVEKILQRDQWESEYHRQEEMGAKTTLARNNNKRMPGRRKRSGRRSSADSRVTSVDREYSDTSETTRLLRKYGVREASTSSAAVSLGHGQFVQKDEQGFYYVNSEEDERHSPLNQEQSQQKSLARYKSRFIKDMGWGGYEDELDAFVRGREPPFSSRSSERKPNAWDSEGISSAWDNEHKSSACENKRNPGARSNERARGGRGKIFTTQQRSKDTMDDQSPKCNTIKIVEGNSFWEEVWNKLSRKLSRHGTEQKKPAIGEEEKRKKLKSSMDDQDMFKDELRDLSPNNSLVVHHPSGRGYLPRDLIGETEDEEQSILYREQPVREERRGRKAEKNERFGEKRSHASKEREFRHGGGMRSKEREFRHGGGMRSKEREFRHGDGMRSKERELIQGERMRSRSIKGEGRMYDSFEASEDRIRTAVESFDSRPESPSSRYMYQPGSPPQPLPDTQSCDSTEEPVPSGTELDKDRVLFSPWEEDKLSDLVKPRDKQRPGRGVSYTIIRHENGEPKGGSRRGYNDGDNDTDNNDDDDGAFTTASAGGPSDNHHHHSRPRTTSPDRWERGSRRSSRSRKTSTHSGYPSCKYDNLLPGDDDYIMAVQTSATSVTSSVVGHGRRSSSRQSNFSDSSPSARHLDETRNCLSAQRKRLSFASNPSSVGPRRCRALRGARAAGGDTLFSYNQRNRSPGAAGGYGSRSASRHGRREKSYFTDCEWPYPLGFFTGPSSPNPKSYGKTSKRNCSPNAAACRTPKTRNGSNKTDKIRTQLRAETVNQARKTGGSNGKTKAIISQTTPTDSRNSSFYDAQSSKNGAGSVDWVKQRQIEKSRGRGDECVSIHGPKETSDVNISSSIFQGKKPDQTDALETINIRGPLQVDKNRRPLIEVNIFGPLNDDEDSVEIRKSRGSQSGLEDLKKFAWKVGGNVSEDDKGDSSPGVSKKEDNESSCNTDNTDNSRYLCGKCYDQDESTNHTDIPIEREVVPRHAIQEGNTRKLKSFHGDAKKPPFVPVRRNKERQPMNKKQVGVSFDENCSKSKPQTISSSQQTETPSQSPDESLFVPTFSFITTDIPVPRSTDAHQNRKVTPQTKRTDSEKTRQNVVRQSDRDGEKSTQKFDDGDSRCTINHDNTESRSKDFYSPKSKGQQVGTGNLKSKGGALSQKTNLTTLANRPRSSSDGKKALTNNPQAVNKDKAKPIISVPTGQPETDVRPRSRSLSACRSNVKTGSDSKIRSSCYPYYYYDQKEDLTAKKGKLTDGQQSDSKRPPAVEKEDKFNLFGRNRGIISTTWKTKKYPETIWHKYVKAERENQNWSNKFAGVRGVKGKESQEGAFVTKRKVPKPVEEVQPHAITKEMKVVPTETSGDGENSTDKSNASSKSETERNISKFKKPSCINIKETAGFNSWYLCSPQQDGSNNRSELPTMGSEYDKQKGNNVWGDVIKELVWPIAGHRIDYHGDLVSSHPTARMVEEPIVDTEPAKDDLTMVQPDGSSSSGSEDDTKNGESIAQIRPRPSDVKKPSRSDRHSTRGSTDAGYHRSQSRDTYQPPRRRKSCCGNSRPRKRSDKSPPSSSSSTSPSDSPAYQRRRSNNRITKNFPVRRKLQKSKGKSTKETFVEGSDFSAPAPPPSLISIPSPLETHTQNKRALTTRRGRARFSSSQTRTKTVASRLSQQNKHADGFAVHPTDGGVYSASSSDDEHHKKTQSLIQQQQQQQHSGDATDDSDAFWAAQRVLREPRPINEPQWEDQHASLMGDCSQENINNSWRRMRRIETKAKNLEGSMSRLKLNFGDIETRLDKVKVVQQEYMNRAEEAVEMLCGRRRGRSRSRRSQKPRNKSRSNGAQSASSDRNHHTNTTSAKMDIDNQMRPTNQSPAKVQGPYAKNKRQGTFICAKSSTGASSNRAGLGRGERKTSREDSLRVPGGHNDAATKERMCQRGISGHDKGMSQIVKEINRYMETSRKFSKSRSRSNESRVRKRKQSHHRTPDCPERNFAHNSGCNGAVSQSRCRDFSGERLKLNIPLDTDPCKQRRGLSPRRRRGRSSTRGNYGSRACSLTKDSNNSNRQQRSWSSILAAYQTLVKRSSSAHSDTEGPWSDQEGSNNSDEEDDVTRRDQEKPRFKPPMVSDEQVSSNDDQDHTELKSNYNTHDKEQKASHPKIAWDEITPKDIRKMLYSDKRCSCSKESEDMINKLSDLLQNVFIKKSYKKHAKGNKVFANTNKCLSKVYARPTQPCVSSGHQNNKMPRLVKNRAEILKELAKYRRAYEDSVYAQKLGLRSSSATPCSGRQRSSSRPRKAGNRPMTYTQLYHDRVRYERSPSRHRPTTVSQIPELETADRACSVKKPANRFRQVCLNGCSAGKRAGTKRDSKMLGFSGQCEHGIKVPARNDSVKQPQLREIHVHIPQEAWLPEPSSSVSSRNETPIINPRRKPQCVSSKAKFPVYGIRGSRVNNGSEKSRSRRCSRTRCGPIKTLSNHRSPFRNDADETPASYMSVMNGLDFALSSPPPPPSSPVNSSQNKQCQAVKEKGQDKDYNYNGSGGNLRDHLNAIPCSEFYEDDHRYGLGTTQQDLANHPASYTHSLSTDTLGETRRPSWSGSGSNLEGREFLGESVKHAQPESFNCLHKACDGGGILGQYDQTLHNSSAHKSFTLDEGKPCESYSRSPSQNNSYTPSNNGGYPMSRYLTDGNQLQYLQGSATDASQREQPFVSNFMRSIENEIGFEALQRKEHSLTLRSLAPIRIEHNDTRGVGDVQISPQRHNELRDMNHSAIQGEYHTAHGYDLINDRYLDNQHISQVTLTQQGSGLFHPEPQCDLDLLTHDLPDNPISDTDDGGLAGSTNRVRFAEPISQVTELSEAVSDYKSGRWRKLGTTPGRHVPAEKASNERKKEKDPWENTRRVLNFLGGCNSRVEYTNSVSTSTKLGTFPPARPLSADAASLGRRQGHTDLTRLTNLPPSPSRLLCARQQRAPPNLLGSARRSDDSGCETGGDLDTHY